MIPAPVRGAGLPLDGEYCARHDEVIFQGETFQEGSVVRCRQQCHDNRRMRNEWVERVATLREIYEENHPGVGQAMLFAEAESEGKRIRIWFRRDRITLYPLGDAKLPAPLAGMLW